MRYSVDEKLAYNRKRKGRFSTGYLLGVAIYRDYPKGDSVTKRNTKEIISDSNALARIGDDYGKGVMCGVRDAANERKARKKDRPP